MFDALHELELEQSLSIIFHFRTGTEVIEIMNKFLLQICINFMAFLLNTVPRRGYLEL